MMKREDIIRSLLDQARDKDHLDDGRGEIFAEDAKALREAAQMLNMDADLRDQYECAIQANESLVKANKPVKPIDLGYGYYGRLYKCGHCGCLFKSKQNYCHECGKAVSWE